MRKNKKPVNRNTPAKILSTTPEMSVRRSLFYSFAQKYSGLVFTIPTIMIVSRLLTPAQVGVYSLAMAFVALIHMLRDFGVSDFLVQVPELDEGLARSAFTVTLTLGWLMALIIVGLSWPLAAFYDEPGLATVMQILSVNFFLLPFGSVAHALLKRFMQYSDIYKIQVSQSATQSVATVVLVYVGFGYVGLAWASVVSTFVMIGVTYLVARRYWIDGLGLHRWREVGHFGVQRVLGDVIGRMGQSAPDFVIGRVIDFAAVGLYSRGQGLIRLFRENVLGAIGAVTFSAYARDFRSTSAPDKLFLRVLSIITGFSWPFLLFVAIMAFPIMRIMFGEQWDAAVPILQLLAISASVIIVSMECPQLLTAVGRVGTVTRIVAVEQSVRIGVLVVTAFYGINAVAAGLILVVLFSMLLYYRCVLRHTDVTFDRVVAALRPSVVTTLVTIAPTAALAWFFPPTASNLWAPLLAGSAGAAVLWPLGLKLSGHPLLDEVLQTLAVATQRVRRHLAW